MPRNYFDRVVKGYSVSDVQKVLGVELDAAGPILQLVFAGIDMLGGIEHGFRRDNSKDRSVDVMRDHFMLDESVATALYQIVRCGAEHQGAPKAGFKIWDDKQRTHPGKYLYKEHDLKTGENWIHLNLREFAFAYLAVVNKFERTSGLINHVPTLLQKEEQSLADCLQAITDDYESFTNDLPFSWGSSGSPLQGPSVSSPCAVAGGLRPTKLTPKVMRVI